MDEPKLKQPAVLGGPCDGGNGYQGCNMVLTYECTQCGRREAADESAKASLEDGSAFDAAHAPQPWIAEPTRAGWWVWWDFAAAAPELYLIKIEDTPLTKGAFYFHPRRQRWESCGFKNWRAMGVRGGWAGPVERPQAPDEETGHTDGDQR